MMKLNVQRAVALVLYLMTTTLEEAEHIIMIAQRKHAKIQASDYRRNNSGSSGHIGRNTPCFVISERLPTEAIYHFVLAVYPVAQ